MDPIDIGCVALESPGAAQLISAGSRSARANRLTLCRHRTLQT
jgi:hypothetical protein